MLQGGLWLSALESKGVPSCVLWRFLIVTGDLRMSHPARYQVTLLLTNVNRVDACGLRQLVLNLPEERRIQNLLVVAVQHPYICPVLIRINIIFYDSEYCPSFRSCWVPSR